MDRIEDFQELNASTNMKNAASKAIKKLKIYYAKTDAIVFTIATIIDPRLKVFYHEEHKWERKYIEEAKAQFQAVFNSYHQAPQAISNDIEIRNDLISQIYLQSRSSSRKDEADLYLKSTRATPEINILEWWKVK